MLWCSVYILDVYGSIELQKTNELPVCVNIFES